MKLPGITPLILLIIFITFIPSCGEPEWPEGLPHGELNLPNINDPDTPGAYFDLSEGELVYGEEGRQRGDVYLDVNFVCGNPALGVEIHDAQPDSLLYDTGAPGWGTRLWKISPDGENPPRIGVINGHNIWVRTAEGNIGKFRIMSSEPNDDYTNMLSIKIQWIFQPDLEKNDLSGTAPTDSGTATETSG